MKYRIEENLSFEKYCDNDYVNASLLKLVSSRSLFHAKSYLTNSYKRDSAALDFGRAFHEFILEGICSWACTPAMYPCSKSSAKKRGINEGDLIPWDGRSAYCKEWKEDQESRGISVFDREEDRALRGMEKVLRSDPRIDFNGKKELSLFVDRPDGIKLKARLDLLPDNPELGIVDLKTTLCARPSTFVPQMISLNYHMQAAAYLDVLRMCGIKRDRFTIVAIEKTPPFAHSLIYLDDVEGSLLRVGRIEYIKALNQLTKAISEDVWPSYESGQAENWAPNYMTGRINATI